mgnify:CR=1 FL=1
MKDEIFFRDKLEDEWEANEVYAILSECDKDFEPPLSEREALFKRHGRKNLVTVSEITLMRWQNSIHFY